MKLNIIEKLILLSLDDEKGNLISSGPQFNTAVAGATIAELVLLNKLRISHKKLKVSNTKSTGDKVLDYALMHIMESNNEKSIQHWITFLSDKVSKTIEISEQKFVDNKILIRQETKVLWFFDITNFPAKDSSRENIFRKDINEIVFRKKEAKINDKILIGLIEESDLNKKIYGKNLNKESKKRIKDIVNSDALSKVIHSEVKNAFINFTAIMVAVM